MNYKKEMKIIARRPRRDVNSNFLHIIVQGIEKQYIFDKEIFKYKYLKLIEENLEEYNIKLIAYTIMDNHAHLCIYHENILNVSKFMHKINSLFASYYNYIEGRVGYLFRNRFYSQEIFDRQQLYNVISYIHNNPLKARMVDKLENYNHSSYAKFKNRKIDKDIILLVFETENYMDIFDYIHKNYNELTVLDIKEEKKCNYEKIIEDYCIQRNISVEYVKYNDEKLIEIIKILKLECSLTNKEISQIFKINKNKVGRIIRKLKEK